MPPAELGSASSARSHGRCLVSNTPGLSSISRNRKASHTSFLVPRPTRPEEVLDNLKVPGAIIPSGLQAFFEHRIKM
jgi:hypothetical protein